VLDAKCSVIYQIMNRDYQLPPGPIILSSAAWEIDGKIVIVVQHLDKAKLHEFQISGHHVRTVEQHLLQTKRYSLSSLVEAMYAC
jgi:hypothetical protein